MAFGDWQRRVFSGQGALRMLKQSGAPIAIDFGVGSLKVLQLAGEGEPRLHAAACVETPDSMLSDHAARLEFQVGALRELIQSGRFKGKRAVSSIPAGQTYSKHLQFPAAERPNLASHVEAALSAQMACDPSALVFRHVEVGPIEAGPAAGKLEVICSAVSRTVVDRLIQGIKSCKLEPVGLHSEFIATARALEPLRPSGDTTAGLYLDIGAGSTKVMISHKDALMFARTVDVGARHLRRAPASAPAPPAAGSAGAVATLEPPRPAPGVELSEPLEMLCDEAAMCLRYHGAIFPARRVGRAIFVGGQSRQTALCRHIARALRLPAQTADPMANVAGPGRQEADGVDFKTTQPGWALPLGLSLLPTDL